MEILPSEYQHNDLSRSEKIFVRNVMSNEQFGFLLLGTNPAMLPNESMHILICSDGVLFLKFFEGFEDAAQFGIIMPMMIDGLYNKAVKVIKNKVISNKALVDENGLLWFPMNLIYIFPALKREDVSHTGDETLQEFVQKHCWFIEDLQKERIKEELKKAGEIDEDKLVEFVGQLSYIDEDMLSDWKMLTEKLIELCGCVDVRNSGKRRCMASVVVK